MININANELTILKACLDNAQDAAGGDFGFSDEVHGYVSDGFSQHQVAGYLSQLQEKNLIWLDEYQTDTSEGKQITFPKATIIIAVQAGLLTENEATAYDCYHGDELNGDPSEYDFERPATAEPKETIKYGQIIEACKAAKDAEEEADSWLKIAKLSAGDESFDARTEQYREAAQRAIIARLAWLDIRNRFESGE